MADWDFGTRNSFFCGGKAQAGEELCKPWRCFPNLSIREHSIPLVFSQVVAVNALALLKLRV
jgi:hypothetical protein